MATTQLAATGKDTQLQIMFDTGRVEVISDITDFSATNSLVEIQTFHINTSGSRIQNEFSHWEGSIGLTKNSQAIDTLLDLIQRRRKNNLPYMINLVNTTNYKDGTSVSYVYLDVEFGAFDASMKRGEALSVTIPWKSGKDRQLL